MTPSLPPEPAVGTFVSTFTGAGGMDIGFAMAGFEPAWANDIDPAAVSTYNRLFPGHVARQGDLRSQELPGRGSADLVIGGPPCQGFSVAGKMDPNDPRSRHVWDFLGVVARIRPRAFVMENVKALAVNRRWTSIRHGLITESEALGYRTQLLLLNASHFGVPQARERMFLIGMLDGDPVEPRPITAGSPPTVRQALATLSPYGQAGNDTKCNAVITTARQPVLRRSPYAGMLFNGQGRPLDPERPATTLPASMGGNRTPIIDQSLLEGATEESWVVRYHAHLWAGGKPWDEVPPQLRRLTVEECAALQTFPTGMHWSGGQNAAYRQIGNAVPPILAMQVALAIRKSLHLGQPETIDEGPLANQGRERLLVEIRDSLPAGIQLSLEVEEHVRAYARNGDHAHLREAIKKVEEGVPG